MTTIADVAALAGVSVATVSRTLHESARVDPRTREKVQAAAAALDYVASPTAMSLASGRTNIVAVVAPLMSRWFFATIVTTIEQELRSQGYHVLLIILEGEGTRAGSDGDVRQARRRIISLNVRPSADELAMLERLRLPIVAVGMPLGNWPRVHIDDAAAVRSAVQHLIGLGHPTSVMSARPTSFAHMATPGLRVEAFRAAITEAGLPAHPEWAIASEWTADAAARRVEQVLRNPCRPTGDPPPRPTRWPWGHRGSTVDRHRGPSRPVGHGASMITPSPPFRADDDSPGMSVRRAARRSPPRRGHAGRTAPTTRWRHRPTSSPGDPPLRRRAPRTEADRAGRTRHVRALPAWAPQSTTS